MRDKRRERDKRRGYYKWSTWRRSAGLEEEFRMRERGGGQAGQLEDRHSKIKHDEDACNSTPSMWVA